MKRIRLVTVPQYTYAEEDAALARRPVQMAVVFESLT
jgi:hypothetical protein